MLCKSLLVDYDCLSDLQEKNDTIGAMQILKKAFNTDVTSIVSMARFENSNAIDPISLYRSLNYKQNKSKVRASSKGSSSGIV